MAKLKDFLKPKKDNPILQNYARQITGDRPPIAQFLTRKAKEKPKISQFLTKKPETRGQLLGGEEAKIRQFKRPFNIGGIRERVGSVIRSVLPKDIEEGLLGPRRREASETFDAPFTTRLGQQGLLGSLFPFVLRTEDEKIEAQKRDILRNSDISQSEADKIATLSILASKEDAFTEANKPNSATQALRDLNLSDEQLNSIVEFQIEEGLGTALDLFNVAPVGFIKNISRSGQQKIARSVNADEIFKLLKSEIPGLQDDVAKAMSKPLVFVRDPDDVQKVLNRTELAIQEAKRAKQAETTASQADDTQQIIRQLPEETRQIATPESNETKFFAEPSKVPLLKDEESFVEAHKVFHGANTKFADQLEKTKTFKPGAKREAGTGGNMYGLSATTDSMMAKDFSTSATGEGRVVELYIDPKARVLNLKGKEIDDLSETETRRLAKDYDVIRDIDNVGGEGEVRILNPNILRDRSQIESAWVLQETGITDLYNAVKTTPKVADDIPSSLIEEARKYKSAEEFVEAQQSVFHGTNVKFDSFDRAKLGVSTKAKSAEKGFWFVDNEDIARGYGEYASEKPVRDILDQIKIEERKGNWDKAAKLTEKAEKLSAKYTDPVVIKAKLNLKNPMVYDAKGKGFLATDQKVNDLIDEAIKRGNDGLIIKNLEDTVYSADVPATHTIVFDDKAILTKSQLTSLYNQVKGAEVPTAPRAEQPTTAREVAEQLPEDTKLRVNTQLKQLDDEIKQLDNQIDAERRTLKELQNQGRPTKAVENRVEKLGAKRDVLDSRRGSLLTEGRTPVDQPLKVTEKQLTQARKRAVKTGVRFGKKIGKTELRTQQQQTQFLRQLRKDLTQSISRNYRNFQKTGREIEKVIDGESTRRIDVVVKEAREAGRTIDDALIQKMEEGLTNRLLSRFRGNTELIKKRLRDKGVSEETIESARIEDTFPLDDTVKIKREETGEISATISQSYLDEVKKAFTGKVEGERAIKKFGLENITRGTKDFFGQFVVPQEFFRRTGLKNLIYDRVRYGELQAETKFTNFRNELHDVFGDLFPTGVSKVRRPLDRLLEVSRVKTDPVKQSRRNIFRYFATQQGRASAMRQAGVKPVKWGDLTAKEKRVVQKWKVFNDKYKDEIMDLARKHGKDIQPIENNYFPLYSRNDLVMVGDGATIDSGSAIMRKDPFFRSLLERQEDVPYSIYNEDALENAISWAQGAARFTEVGKRTVPIKFLIESDEFGEIVGTEVQSHIRNNWLQKITTPNSADSPGAGLFKFFKRTTYWSLIGGVFGSPITIAKQAISYSDIAITNRLFNRTAKWAKKVDKPSVTERKPFIGIDSTSTAADKALLGGITVADQAFAGGAFNKLLTQRINQAIEAGETVNIKTYRRILRDVSDEIDLAFGGATPAQRPPIYNTQLGEAALTLMSTINSQFQYYIKNVERGISDRDLKLLSSVLTAFVFASYAEQAITRMDLGFEDEEQFWKEMLYSTGGKVPIIGSLMFAIETESSPQPSAMLANLSAVFENGPTIWELSHLVGTPRQFKKYAEGYDAVRTGTVEVGGSILPVEGFAEQTRAIMRGKYGPLVAQNTFLFQDRLSVANSSDILSDDEKKEFFNNVNKALKQGVIDESKANKLKDTLTKNQNKIKARVLYDEFKDASPEVQREATKDLEKGIKKEIQKIVEEETKQEMLQLYLELKDAPDEVQIAETAKLESKERKVLKDIIEQEKENRELRVKLLNELRNETINDDKTIIDKIKVYAEAIKTDWWEAATLMLDGETIRRTDAGQIIVERDTDRVDEAFKTKDGLERDHIMPLQLGGTNAIENIEYVDVETHRVHSRVGNFLRRQAIGEVITMDEARKLFVDYRKGNLEEEEVYDLVN